MPWLYKKPKEIRNNKGPVQSSTRVSNLEIMQVIKDC